MLTDKERFSISIKEGMPLTLEILKELRKEFSETYYPTSDKRPLLDIYNDFCATTRLYPLEKDEDHIRNGLIGEIGEYFAVEAKHARGDFGLEEKVLREKKELGDVFYYLIRECYRKGYSPYQLMLENMDKLVYRFTKNTVKGDGDNR